jgi:MerR family redox-sensitive transcriptional activator SoxR
MLVPMTTANALLTIGEAARRAGLSVAALRYYEQRGLVASTRTGGNQRRYPRWVLRRLAFIAAAQRIGLNLDQVKEALDTLPTDRVPTHTARLARLARPWRQQVADRLLELQALQNPAEHPRRLPRMRLPVAHALRPVQRGR